ncbi:YciI family protein [Paraburkholderia dinghuensis]|uniref:YciI family protein n=1 Tax=Paraburkholderia dinghuensis TaxID=2305225 RepID=A0A3N6PL27_9BURK|nr:YciI family protein [Paraburkholderia dinghuensis]RQH02080.1 YciI family protein [Paraburkholderia dinghuensis]
MRFMIMVRANALSESGEMHSDDPIFAEMAAYHEELAKAGVLLDASGLKPSSCGWRVRYSEGKPTIVDGPFAETNELIAGYTLIQVRSREEALEWARRFPAPFGKHADGEIEVRQLYELEDFEQNDSIERFREIEKARGGTSSN